MKFELRPARPADVEAIMQVMADAMANLQHPEWFVPDDAVYMAEHISGSKGFCLKPADGVLVGLQSILLQLTDGCVIFNNIDHKILQTNRPKPAICHRFRPILQGKALR